MSHPSIGLTARTVLRRSSGKTRPTESLLRDYADHLEAEGALPWILPNALDPSRARDYLERVDALVLTGGDDVHAHLFGEEPHPRIEVVDERRDRFEIELAKGARALGIPVLGICRGIQVMNIACGGDIHQDVPSQTSSQVAHVQRTLDDGAWHQVEVEEGSLLAGIHGAGRLGVNSFHHQACRRLGEGLRASARCPADGLVEAIEDPRHPFFLGVQWHPEIPPAPGARVFGALVRAARERAAASSNRGSPARSGR